MKHTGIKTLGALKTAGYTYKTIKEELRSNLINLKKAQKETFTGVHGYEKTVIPQLERAILSKHNINLLGLRGQAKTRLARQMVNLLDEYIPVVSGSEINDNPLKPISRFAKELIAEQGDETPITWLHRSERFAEKLATPDVTVADIIGDIDPIKAANLKLSYADDRVIHYGMIPRANRSIFVINELPDLQARIQVALFNILQEGDIQIRGFKLRFDLDMQFVFTANPEDYTNRGSIITPLKDRIGSQILTHYPDNIAIAKTITQQEAKLEENQSNNIYVPELAKDLLEQIGFEARDSEYVDVKSGVSARLSISAYENLLSTAELRMLATGETNTSVRLSDFMGIIPAINGKIELVYEGEQEGAASVAENLINDAIKTLFPTYFPAIEKLVRKDASTPYDEIIKWFIAGDDFELANDLTDKEYQQQLEYITPLTDLLQEYQPDLNSKDLAFFKEFVLWSLVEHKKLNKVTLTEGYGFKDSFESFIDGI
ncbi:magnesium chelatase [Wenyingzhuangia fucanilytica]|uniref:Magnesium chelatase n=1 Tax=Wenyingzhuangia fucanilytica TaxID=1790137 RepID=A0A1B1Y9K5_9FLAO|nr:magnesium chelatase [Wenyingzhuangia fucanilytica]ANW97457.1 magnesium chelatase [Wenyingzhuangia fucanilytica]